MNANILQQFLIIDDHEIVFKGLATILEQNLPGMTAVWAHSKEVIPELLRQKNWGLIITELEIGGFSLLGSSAYAQVWKDIPTLVFTGQKQSKMEALALRLGVAGYLNKDVESATLLAAVKKVLDGNRYYPCQRSMQLADVRKTADQEAVLPSELSARDLRVLRMLVAGFSLKEIAANMSVSYKTAGCYRTQVYSQIKAANIAEVIRYCVKHQLQIAPVGASEEVKMKVA